MKKQINPNIKAHLIRSAFYVLLLLAVCVIPFALAQRNTTRRAATKPKVAANTKLAPRAATSQLRNDVVSAQKGKVKASTNRFSNAFGTRRSAPNGTTACWYDLPAGAGTFVPGVDPLNLDCDDCGTDVPLPFTVNLYGGSFNTIHVGSNGYATFGTPNDGFTITCPPPFGLSGTNLDLAPYWTDQTVFLADGDNIFTTTTGSPGSQIFYIEWRSKYFGSPEELNYEIALHEDGNPPFEFIYNIINVASTGNDSQLVVGQKFDENCFTLFGCDATGGGAPPVGSGQSLAATSAPTPTPTPTPACSPVVIEDSITLGDPTQTDRLFRDGVPSTCDAPKICPGAFGDFLQHHYKSYTFSNNTGSTQCATIDIDTQCGQAGDFIFATVYSGSFNPLDLCENYLADEGSSPFPTAPFSFNVADGQTVVIVVAEVTADTGCPDYVMTITNLCGGGGGPCSLQPWNIVGDYPLISESVSVSSDGTFGYGVGGFDGTLFIPTDSFNLYDLGTQTWSPLPNIPTAFYDAPSVYVPDTNSIYVFGGLDSSFLVRDITQVYDITSGTWGTGAPMPDPAGRYFAAATYDPVSHKVYVMGGFDGITFSEQTNNWIYDPVADSWDSSTALPIPVGIGGAGYSIVGQNVYLQGHWNGGLGSTDNYRYDIVANTWTPMAPVPVNIYRPASGSIGTNTYLVGGGDPFVAPGKAQKGPKRPEVAPHPSANAPATSFNTTWVYDTLGDSWSAGPNTNVAHSFTGGTAIGTHFIVVTGFNGGGDTATTEQSDCTSGGGTPTPTPTPGTPTPTPTPGGSCPPFITQSTSTTIEQGDSIACNNGFETTENHYWRAFDMGTFTGGAEYDVSSIDMGVELAVSSGGGNTVTVNIYANHGAPFPGGDWQSNLVGTSGPINIPDQQLTFPVNIPITANVAAGTLELVLEVITADGQGLGNEIFIGANSAAETGPSYISAADCGVTVPTPVGDLGFPNTHWVFNVNGTCPGTPTPTPTATATATVTVTPTATPRPSLTPRPRPTPHPRP